MISEPNSGRALAADSMPVTAPSPPAAGSLAAPLSRPQMLAWTLLGILPLSVLVALIVVNLMAASAANATGGCGGG